MIERRLAASPALSFGTMYGAPGPAYKHGNAHPGFSYNQAGFGAFGSHLPSQVMDNNDGSASLTPIHPMSTPAINNQLPMHAPIPPDKDQPCDQRDSARQPSMGENRHSSQGRATYPVLTQPSAQSSSDGHSRQLALQKESAPINDYVDLSRSSVSPYQAAQYAEISRRLNTEVPQGLQLDRDLPPLPPPPLPPLPPKSGEVSPFDDPESATSSPGDQFAIDHRNLDSNVRPTSGDSTLSVASNTLDFPVPPSPAYVVSSRYRINSNPPILPEISVESRASNGLRNALTVAGGRGSSDGLKVTDQRFPVTPSPLASSFGVPFTPDVKESSFAAAPSVTHPTAPLPLASTTAPDVPIEKKRTTTYSLYDTEDAYGGI